MPIDLIMLDFDGTIADSAPDIYAAVLEMLKRNGRAPVSFEMVKTHIGEGFGGLIYDVFPEQNGNIEFREKMYREFCDIYDTHFLNQPLMFKGVQDFLNSWTGQLAIVSNKPERYIKPMLKKMNLMRHNWCAIVGGDTFEKAKPHSLPVDNVVEKSGAKTHRCVLVGDGLQDVGAALAAGVHMVAVDYGYVTKERLKAAGAQHFVSNLTQLPDAFRRLSAS